MTAPEERLWECLNAKDVRVLKKGRISQSALFTLVGWVYDEGDKRLMLKLLREFDLMLLQGDEEYMERHFYSWRSGPHDVWLGRFLVGSCSSGDGFRGHNAVEEPLPCGLIGNLIAHMHRTLSLRESNARGTKSPSPIVRADTLLC